MRRTKGGFLHPALKMKLGEQGLERLVGDAAGVRRVSEQGSRVDYLPVEPDLDITSYHEQVDFKDSRDTDTSTMWVETGVNDATGTPLTAVDWGGLGQPHATLTSGLTEDDYWQYQRRELNYYPTQGSDNRLWFLSRVRLVGESDVNISYAEIGDATLTRPDNGYGFYYFASSNSWYFGLSFTPQGGVHQTTYIPLGEGSSEWVEMSVRILYDDGTAILTVVLGNNSTVIPIDGLTPGLPLFDKNLHLTFGIRTTADLLNGRLDLQFLKTILDKGRL